MTLWYSSRRPAFDDFPAIVAMKWSHSILQEPTFKCEFAAREQALRLSLEVGSLFEAGPRQAIISSTVIQAKINLACGF